MYKRELQFCPETTTHINQIEAKKKEKTTSFLFADKNQFTQLLALLHICIYREVAIFLSGSANSKPEWKDVGKVEDLALFIVKSLCIWDLKKCCKTLFLNCALCVRITQVTKTSKTLTFMKSLDTDQHKTSLSLCFLKVILFPLFEMFTCLTQARGCFIMTS